ncbi:MAG: hypothetical protein GF309_13775 [Candidatus Lokiarchaeota archaeon]|nr:hypothetical protein [Candidatus Lokiarchaeota archaeon]
MQDLLISQSRTDSREVNELDSIKARIISRDLERYIIHNLRMLPDGRLED